LDLVQNLESGENLPDSSRSLAPAFGGGVTHGWRCGFAGLDWRMAILAKDAPMPATMNVSLPEPLKRFVDEQVREGGYASTSDYVRELIRKDRDAAALRGLLMEGLASGPAAPVDDAWFESLRQRARKRRAR
jgi:antitoxin ParD1/3/4